MKHFHSDHFMPNLTFADVDELSMHPCIQSNQMLNMGP